MRGTRRDSATAVAMGVLLAYAILTLWIRDPRALAIFQVGVLAVAAARIVADAFSGRATVWHPVLAPIAGVIGVGLLQLAAGTTAYRWDTLGAVLNWTTHLAAAFAILQALVDDTRRDRWLNACALFAIGLSVVSILQLFTSGGKVFWVFDSGYDTLVLGPFVYHNRFAQFAELLMPIAMYRAIVDRERRPLWLLGAGILFAGIIAAMSRGGLILAVLEILAVLACAASQGLIGKRMWYVAAGQIAGVALVWGTVAGWSGVLERLLTLNPMDDMRLSFYQSSFGMLREHALTGAGLSTWPVVYPQYASFDPGLFVNTAHSDWLQWAAEGGLVTLLLMAAAVACLVRPAIRSVWGVGLFVVLAHGLFDYPMQDPAFATVVFAFAATIAAGHVAHIRSRCRAVFSEGRSIVVKRVTVLPLMALCLAIAPEMTAQSKPTSIMGPMGDAGLANLPGQKIGPNDLIAISVYDAPEFTRTVRVGPDGSVTLPMVSRKIAATGLLPGELERAIAERLVNDGILVKPVVMVTVAEYHSRPISVMGAVHRPVTFQSVGRITVLDALARAEGLTADAGPEILLTRFRVDPGTGSPVGATTHINVRELIDRANPEVNILLTGDEEIRVPEARKFYVVGNVKKPGAFPVRDAGSATVLRALALAEGLGPFTQKMAYIYRAEASGARREIPVELAKLIDRKVTDIALEADDVLYIPENRGKKNIVTALEKASSFGLSTASGVLIWRR